MFTLWQTQTTSAEVTELLESDPIQWYKIKSRSWKWLLSLVPLHFCPISFVRARGRDWKKRQAHKPWRNWQILFVIECIAIWHMIFSSISEGSVLSENVSCLFLSTDPTLLTNNSVMILVLKECGITQLSKILNLSALFGWCNLIIKNNHLTQLRTLDFKAWWVKVPEGSIWLVTWSLEITPKITNLL